ncbi:hypothetical protein JCM30394_01070 [Deferrisoma palaeochoriense]
MTNVSEECKPVVFLLETFRELVGAEGAGVDPWIERLRSLEGANGFRLAVAGTVKSGKSTLVNALVGRDVLRRGAGIITSLVTRVRPGPEPRARLRLKGWAEVNREATDAALLLAAGDDGRRVDLRSEADRRRLREALDELGDRALGEGGSFDRNVALLRAYLDGYERIREWLGEEPRELELGPDRFEQHRAFAGDDALAVYVDDLVIELPGTGLPGGVELGDCQGYDSPNPRHREKVQEYLLGAHGILYVVSSRVGLREADLRFVRDIKALGLLEAARFVLNADLGEHPTAEDLAAIRDRVAAELAPLAGRVEVAVVSALRGLLLAKREAGAAVERKEELLLELWEESPARALDGFPGFREALFHTVAEARERETERTVRSAVRGAARALLARVDSALTLAREETTRLAAEQDALVRARAEVEASLGAFEKAVRAAAAEVRERAFRRVDRQFHPSGGEVAERFLAKVRELPAPELGATGDRKRFHREMARVYQEMRAAFQALKVEELNPRAVEAIRAVWAEASSALKDAARGPAELLVRNVEAYNREAQRLGLPVAPFDPPELDPSIGRRVIPLPSAVTYAGGEHPADRALGLAAQWTRKAAAGWARRLVGRTDRAGFAQGMLADWAEAVREVLLEEARSNLLHYNEQVKYQLVAANLEALADAWIAAYRELAQAALQDLSALERAVEERRGQGADLVPRLEGLRDAVAPLAA